MVLPDLPAEKPDEAGNSEDDKAKKDIEINVKAGKDYNKITITLNNGTKVDGFQIYRSTDNKKGFRKIKTTSKSTFKDKKSLVSGTQYYYKARGYVKVNGKKYYSDWSDVAGVSAR